MRAMAILPAAALCLGTAGAPAAGIDYDGHQSEEQPGAGGMGGQCSSLILDGEAQPPNCARGLDDRSKSPSATRLA